jgi:hypothetical protein
MLKKSTEKIVKTDEIIINKIHYFRGVKVMLDKVLAELYDVTTSNLNKAVKRNFKRFPEDFMFQLSTEELKNLIFQSGTSSWGGTRKPPFAFTENKVSMLSGVLNSDRSIDVNIRIIRVFTKMREMLSSHKDVLLKLEQIEKQTDKNSTDIKKIFNALKQLLSPLKEDEKERVKIGFKTNKK